ncbi:glycoside hydrolase family 25 protein [Neptunitalea lumnitzerae]|uniref:Lysozyme n=1 Tax=Neptunitalea lumnitzerae TaxID=2965509 RepID=A0ABQ5MGP4_9FLAO|nr:GH25 family lysozyme [Neptunitalea sp. Y10]GLB48569.1 hypothetical protein Y10_09370 [Neptunitalea sp. Y10]
MRKLSKWQDFIIKCAVIFLLCYLLFYVIKGDVSFFTRKDVKSLLDIQKTEIVHELSNVTTAKKDSTVNGLDLSHFQNFAVNSANYDEIDFVIFKATQGTIFEDPKFAYNYRETPKEIVKGAYHFYDTGKDPVEQAQFFLKVVKAQDSLHAPFYNMLPPILDIERGSIEVDDISKKEFQDHLKQWLEIVEKETGKRPIIYGSLVFLEQYLDDFYFKKYALWIAEWRNVRAPVIPWIWDNKWTFWQKTDSYQYGVELVDYDVYNGSRAGLQKLTTTTQSSLQ